MKFKCSITQNIVHIISHWKFPVTTPHLLLSDAKDAHRTMDEVKFNEISLEVEALPSGPYRIALRNTNGGFYSDIVCATDSDAEELKRPVYTDWLENVRRFM